MSSKRNRFLGTLSMRLTILYCGLFIVSTLIAFCVIYVMAHATLNNNINNNLEEDIEGLSTLLEESGLERLKEEVQWEVQKDGSEQDFFRLYDRDGVVLFQTDISAWAALEDSSDQIRRIHQHAKPYFSDITLAGEKAKARVIIAPIGDKYILQIGEALGEGEEYLYIFTSVFGKVMILMIFISAVCGWLLARKAMAGVEEVTYAALSVAKGEFTQRVPVKSRGHEIEQLATAFNYMIERIQSLLKGIREVTDNIAHDLRSPLASIRGTTEMTLISSSNINDYYEMAENTIEECDRLIVMINAMLDISEAEAGVTKLEVQSVNFSQVVKQACDLYLPVAEEKKLTITQHCPLECNINGDLKMIQRLVSNLLDNALKYTLPGGMIQVTVKSFEHHIELVVEDNGIGIDEKDLPLIFQRFYRCDESRSREGSGLGLSLVQAIVKVHRGRIDVSSQLGGGSIFTVRLPLSQDFVSGN